MFMRIWKSVEDGKAGLKTVTNVKICNKKKAYITH